MSTISVREFSYNPSAVFARVEKGEAIQVTRHGNVIAILLPGTGASERYAPLVAQGQIRLKLLPRRPISTGCRSVGRRKMSPPGYFARRP